MRIIETNFTNEIKSCEYNLWDETETKEHVDNCNAVLQLIEMRFGN